MSLYLNAAAYISDAHNTSPRKQVRCMDTPDAFFPYTEYRPNQRQMLEFAATVARDGGIGMIDAPTGSGKSSVVAFVVIRTQGQEDRDRCPHGQPALHLCPGTCPHKKETA